jgi:hypothetical protein
MTDGETDRGKEIQGRKMAANQVKKEKETKVKGTISRDFRLLIFFMNQFPPSP